MFKSGSHNLFTILVLFYNALFTIFDPLKDEPLRIRLNNLTAIGRYLANKGSLLFYGALDNENQSKIICYDLTHNKKLWELALLSALTQNPIISPDKAKIFITTHQQILGLCLKSDIQDKPNILWHEKLDGQEYKIKLSDDAKTVYCLGTENGILLAIDTVSGNKKDLGEFKTGRTQQLLGINNNTIYIQQHIF